MPGDPWHKDVGSADDPEDPICPEYPRADSRVWEGSKAEVADRIGEATRRPDDRYIEPRLVEWQRTAPAKTSDGECKPKPSWQPWLLSPSVSDLGRQAAVRPRLGCWESWEEGAAAEVATPDSQAR